MSHFRTYTQVAANKFVDLSLFSFAYWEMSLCRLAQLV